MSNILKTKIKILLLACMLLLCITGMYAQNNKKNLIGTHFALGTDKFYSPGAEGGGFFPIYYYNTGLDYSRNLSRYWDFCTGFEFTRSNMVVKSPDISSSNDNLKLVTIPIQMKFRFATFFYINGGLFLNVLARTGSEWWIPPYKEQTNKVNLFFGCGLGIGFERELKSGITFSLNPYVRWNGLENVNRGKTFLGGLRKEGNINDFLYFQTGASLGVGYKF
jgi:hypothetical protein